MSRKSTDAIVVHCTATLANAPYNVASIRQMHKARGFSDIGYHYLIGLKGEIWQGRKPQDSVGAHVKDFNDTTIGVAYVGGLRSIDAAPTDTRTPEQVKSLIKILSKLSKDYPKAVILGHRDLSKDLDLDGVIEPREYMKMCPCFDAGPWAKSVGLPGGKLSFGKYRKL
jgi:N-acetyl-anhydromuramyl-L-alanine amidase AmpD